MDESQQSKARSSGDAFFISIPPVKTHPSRHYGYTKSAQLVPTEYPNPKPVGQSSHACFATLAASSLSSSLGTCKPVFSLVNHHEEGVLSKSWHNKSSLFYPAANSEQFNSIPIINASNCRRNNLGPVYRASITRRPLQNAGANSLTTTSSSGGGSTQEGKLLLIKGGHVINDDGITLADVLIKGKKIIRVEVNIQHPEAEIVNAEGKFIMPGGIDPHTHFSRKSATGAHAVDTFESGTKAALAGGTTLIINCVDYDGKGLLTSFAKFKEEAEKHSHCNYALCVTVPEYSEKCTKEMTELVNSHGVNSFKFSTALKHTPMLDDCQFYNALKHCGHIGALARLHAEHGDLISMKEEELQSTNQQFGAQEFFACRSEMLEADCASRACCISNMANCPLDILFALNSEVCQRVSAAKRKGQIVFAETIAAALATDGLSYFDSNWNHAAAHVTSPPLRPDPMVKQALVNHLACDEVHMLASSHCAFRTEQRVGKNFLDLPQGVIGVEERMMLCWQFGVNAGKMDPMRFVAVTSSNAAKNFNLYPNKGRVAVDSDADLVIWNPEAERTLSVRTHHSLADISIYEGVKCIGHPEWTIVAGQIVYNVGEIKSTAGSGQYVATAPFSPYIYSRVILRNKEWKSTSKEKMVPGYLPTLKDQNDVYHEFHNRPVTKAGTRNLFDSSFALSGAQQDDNQNAKRLTRVTKPPGGESHGIW